jgi:hypothetical protein
MKITPRLAVTALVALALSGSGVASASPLSATTGGTSESVDCAPGGGRIAEGATAQEPSLIRDKNEANAYGVIKDSPRAANGSITIPTVFHVVSDHILSAAETTRWTSMINAQVAVLNASYSGQTAPEASDSPFRFRLDKITWTVNAGWYTVEPGKNERDMKKALYEGDSTTLNVYAANIGGGLLGWAYFPKGYNNGRDYIDGVVLLDESMPGGLYEGQPWKYGEGDTLTHEVGHWMMLDHTFNKGCSAAGDYVADTPREAAPQFDCPVGANSCTAPGLDPIHNFMDYTQDSCMNMFTEGQVERMNDAWFAFRAGGSGSKG